MDVEKLGFIEQTFKLKILEKQVYLFTVTPNISDKIKLMNIIIQN